MLATRTHTHTHTHIRPNYKHLKSVRKSILEACFDCLESIRHVGEINFAIVDAQNGLMATHFVTRAFLKRGR